jgi:werner syndrome ATP-dependent helicase
MESGPSESDVSADGLIAELLDMGFEFDAISAAMAAVGGPRRAEVLELVLGGSGAAQARRIGGPAQSQRARRGTRASNPRGRFRQSSITDHLASCGGGTKDSGREETTSLPGSAAPVDSSVPDGVVPCSNPAAESQVLVDGSMGQWDHRDRISAVLQKHFGFSCLKSFQMEALDAWFAHRDCLVLAATGSGMPLSFTSD